MSWGFENWTTVLYTQNLDAPIGRGEVNGPREHGEILDPCAEKIARGSEKIKREQQISPVRSCSLPHMRSSYALLSNYKPPTFSEDARFSRTAKQQVLCETVLLTHSGQRYETLFHKHKHAASFTVVLLANNAGYFCRLD